MNVTNYPSPEVIVEADAQVGEVPVWDHRTQRLCWVDIERGHLMESDRGASITSTTSTTQIDGSLGAAVPRAAAPGFGVALEAGFAILCDGELKVIDGVLPESSRRRNDAKCDSRGRLWTGSTHKKFVPSVGALHRWDGAGASQEIASGLVLPNGLGWDVDDTRMYLVDVWKDRSISLE